MLILLLASGAGTDDESETAIISLTHPKSDDRSIAEESRALDRAQGVADRDAG